MTTNAESNAKQQEVNNDSSTITKPTKPINPTNVRKAVMLGKELRKQPDTSKADVARKIYETISEEPREVIVQAFVDGAGLTPKGAQTYFYNCKRRMKKSG